MTNSRPNASSTQPPLAVVGLSALFPKAANSEEFWSNIRRGVDAITEVPTTHWSPEDYFDSDQKAPDMTYARRGGFLSPVPFDPLEFGISPNNLEAIDTSQLLGLVGAKRALEHAGYGAGRQFDRSRVGCILGVTGTLEMVIPLGARLGHPRWKKALKDAGVPDDVAQDVVNRISDSYVPWQENSFPGLLGNVVAGRIANRLDLHGTNCVVDAACASSLSAMHLAALELWTGRSDMVVTGGIDTFNDIFMFMCFSKTPALSPSGDAKPFSEEASGTILGEGVGIVVLKRLDDAERDGDRIYAVIKGIGTSSDGAGNAVYAPKSEGQIRCLQDAYRISGISPDTIELVEAHGTGTKVGDATEVSGLMQVYKSTGRQGTWCAAGSVKSQIGHTKAAAGAAGVIKAVLALQHKVLPPTIKVKQPPSALLADDSPFYVCTEARPWVKPNGHPRRAAVSAFGFGGSNFHCVLEESPQLFDEPDWDADVQVATLSALSLNELAEQTRTILSPELFPPKNEQSADNWHLVRKAARASRASFRVEHPHRLVFVIERDKTDIGKLVDGALSMLDKYADRSSWSTPDGAHYGRGSRAGALGVLFPGQGSQYVGMLRELALRFPMMNTILSEANEVFSTNAISQGRATATRLSDFIYPTPSWTDETRARRDSELRATQIAQPAIGAVSLGALAVLEQFGVRPEAAAGHSYGELTALCASRRFAPQALYRLSMLRGRLMAEAQEVDGGMLAVGAPLTQVEAAIKEMAVDLVVANHNSPNQVVLSGRLPEIDRATALFSQRNLRGKKLPVAAAFHSPLVAGASRAFRPELDGVEFAPSQMPVYANTTATQYPSDPQAARDLLASQLARPVNFVREVEQMYADGVRTFLEVGPSGVLTGLVSSILSGRDFRAIALDSSSGRRAGLFDLANALAQLSASGHSVNWTQWDPETASQTGGPVAAGNRPKLHIPICGANYVKPRAPIPPRPPMMSSTISTLDAFNTRENKMDFGQMDHSTVSTTGLSHSEMSTPSTSFNQGHQVPPKSRVIEVAPQNGQQESPASTPVPEHFAATSMIHPINMDNISSASLTTIEENLRSLQRMQEETARLHQRFLEGQEAALRTFELLAQRHLELISQSQPARSNEGNIRHEAVSQTMLPEIGAPVVARSEASNDVLPALPASVALPFAAPQPIPPQVLAPARSPEVPLAVASPQQAPASALSSAVLAVVSEKTGYPTEMLNLGMSLDHDLGIDSIKRVEILSALQERVPNLPAFKPEELGALHTLNDVVALSEARSQESRVSAVIEQPAISPPSETVAPVFPAVSTFPTPAYEAPSAALPPTSAQASPVAHSSELSNTVLAVVSEKTGYPTEMLNLGMSLDHDLGIDSIKRVEILSALQERVPNLPAFKPEELGALHTLNDIVQLAEARTETAKKTTSLPTPTQTIQQSASIQIPSHSASASTAQAPVKTSGSELSSTVLAVVSEKTGYPTEMLNLEMSLDHDLGIDSIKRVEILSSLQERVPNLPAFKPEELGALHTLNDVVCLAEARSGGTTATSQEPSAPTLQVARTPSLPMTNQLAAKPAGTSSSSGLAATVLQVVSEKTGYPTEMLNLEMSLDHDLGIDSIKRVEILSSLQEKVPNLPAFKPEELGALHTLSDVVSLAEARSSERASQAHAAISQPTKSTAVVSTGGSTHSPTSSGSPIPSVTNHSVPRTTAPTAQVASQSLRPISAIESVLTRSIVQIGDLPQNSTRALLPLARGSEIWITEDGLELSLRIAAELSERGFKPRVVNLDEPFLPAIPERLGGLIIVAPADGMNDRQLWRAIEWLQKAGPGLKRSAATGAAVFATVSRLDGRFGFGAAKPLTDPLSGGLAGLTKSAAREWPELSCKAFDLADGWPSPGEAARVVIDEMMRSGPVEIGLSPSGRCVPTVIEESLSSLANGTAAMNGPAPVLPGDLFVISGGARGVTAETALAIAKAWRPRLAILGRSPEPSPEPDWLAQLTTESEIKQALISHAPAGTLPRAIDSQLKQIVAQREVTQSLARLRLVGVPLTYHAVDVRDLATLQLLITQLQREFGPVRGLLHGAGVLADGRIEDKTREQFDRVFETKVVGLRNLLGAIPENDLRVLGIFSSYTARFGRVGQCDYAIANEALNKLARQFSVKHPLARVASFNWGPWDGGMVTGGLKQIFAAEGVGLIPLAEGAELVVREMTQNISRPVEVLVIGETEAGRNTRRAAEALPQMTSDTKPNLDSSVASQRPSISQSPPATKPSPAESRVFPLNTPVSPAPSSGGFPSTSHTAATPSPLPRAASSNPPPPATASSPYAPSGSSIFGSRSNINVGLVAKTGPAYQVGSSNVLLAGPTPTRQTGPTPPPGPSSSWVFAEIGQVSGPDPDEVKPAFERRINVIENPYLESHVIGGRAVMPLAMIVEWLAHGAMHLNPGLELLGMDDLRVFQGVRLDRQSTASLRVLVGKPARIEGTFHSRVQLTGSIAGRDVVHSGGQIVMTPSYPTAPSPTLSVAPRGYSLDVASSYATRLFHGPHFHGIAAVEACSAEGIVVDSRTSSAPWAWMREPLRSTWIADPLALDSALQAVILWSQEMRGQPCLPCSIAKYRQYRRTFPREGLRITVRVTHATDHSIRADVEFVDAQGQLVARMDGCESVADSSLAAAFQRNRIDA